MSLPGGLAHQAQQQAARCSAAARQLRPPHHQGPGRPMQRLQRTRVAMADPPATDARSTRGATYVLGELLGSGTAARVVVGTNPVTQQQFAVKIQDKVKGSRSRVEQIQGEIAISEKLRHCRHAVQTLDSFEDARHTYIVQELCCGGDLSDLLEAQEGKLSEQEAATIMTCVLEFLADCHAQSICYGDCKPSNFTLRNNYPSILHLMNPSAPKGQLEVVAVDFGCCQEVGEGCLQDTRVTGTPVYMAPENLKACHGLECDVWAAGVMLYQLLSDRFPFWDVDVHRMDELGGAAIRDGILHGPVIFPAHPWNTSVHPSAQDLILRMLDRNVERRISAADALRHPWFAHALQGGGGAAAGARAPSPSGMAVV